MAVKPIAYDIRFSVVRHTNHARTRRSTDSHVDWTCLVASALLIHMNSAICRFSVDVLPCKHSSVF